MSYKRKSNIHKVGLLLDLSFFLFQLIPWVIPRTINFLELVLIQICSKEMKCSFLKSYPCSSFHYITNAAFCPLQSFTVFVRILTLISRLCMPVLACGIASSSSSTQHLISVCWWSGLHGKFCDVMSGINFVFHEFLTTVCRKTCTNYQDYQGYNY